MIRIFRIARQAVAVAAAIAAACGQTQRDPPQPIAIDTTGLTERGEYIVRNVAVCGHCHAEEPDSALKGGRAFRGWRLGAIRASNLTPDPETGIGRWSEAEIIQAIRVGVRPSGQLLAPVMPYHWYNGMSDRDAAAVARYLKHIEPVRNEFDSEPSLAFLVGRKVLLNPEPVRNIADVPRSMTEQYGEYLAVHVAACVDCHTARGGPMSTTRMDRLFAGTADPPDAFPANPSNITPDSATGIGTWTAEQFIRAMRTGVNPGGRKLNPFMPWPQYRRMTDDDLRAIYAYLRTVRPIRNYVPVRDGK